MNQWILALTMLLQTSLATANISTEDFFSCYTKAADEVISAYGEEITACNKISDTARYDLLNAYKIPNFNVNQFKVSKVHTDIISPIFTCFGYPYDPEKGSPDDSLIEVLSHSKAFNANLRFSRQVIYQMTGKDYDKLSHKLIGDVDFSKYCH